ncbi:MAG: XdhC family protein [Gemmataceae bacterium]
MRDLLAALEAELGRGQACVYCSVVDTRGSTPQKAGAAMLVFADGSQAGTLGGGCVEAEVKRSALATLSSTDASGPRLFDFCLDDNYGWDDGLICGGRMQILATPLSAADRDYYEVFRGRVDRGIGSTEAVVVDPKAAGGSLGARWLFDEKGTILASSSGASLCAASPPPQTRENLQPLSVRPKAYSKQGIAYLPVLPRITLLIVGGGHVGQAVGNLATSVDFDIWVLDDRESYVSAERFPNALRRITGDIGQTLHAMAGDLGPSTYALIVTRGHAHDEEALYHLANTQAGYVGMIGSKRKIKLIFDDLIARGLSAESLARVHAPLGFAIGSQTVPEIAVSIVAELIAFRNLGRSIPEARVRSKPIHC